MTTLADFEFCWGTPVRFLRGYLTHWAGRETDRARLLAHGDYAWAEDLAAPLPDGEECGRCRRRQPYFVVWEDKP